MSPAREDEDGWGALRAKVLGDLDRHEKMLFTLQQTLIQFGNRLGIVELKAGLFGAIGGAIPLLLLIAIYLLTKRA